MEMKEPNVDETDLSHFLSRESNELLETEVMKKKIPSVYLFYSSMSHDTVHNTNQPHTNSPPHHARRHLSQKKKNIYDVFHYQKFSFVMSRMYEFVTK